MGTINKTSNGHQTSLLVAKQVPDFVSADHPIFVSFLEKYYEFIAQANSGIKTSDDQSWYYGADYATRSIPDIHDIDTTDLDNFIDSFRRQYAPTLPIQLANTANRRVLYKNLGEFYRARGTEDSFKFLFRMLYDEEIELYYPKRDMLIASGGNFLQRNTIKVFASNGVMNYVGRQITGANSGAVATIERVVPLPHSPDLFFKSGGGPGNATTRDKVLGDTYHPDLLKDLEMPTANFLVNPYTMSNGVFDMYESVYVSDTNSDDVPTNTIIIPTVTKVIYSDSFMNDSANAVVSYFDGTRAKRESSNPPWGTSNISSANTGNWYLGANTNFEGEIRLVSNVASSISKQVLQIGNNNTEFASRYADQRAMYLSKNIPFDTTKLYRMTVRARDLGGNSSSSVTNGNRFYSGVVTLNGNTQIFDANGTQTYGDSTPSQIDAMHHMVSHGNSMDDEFFNYSAYFMGTASQDTENPNSHTPLTGTGGRVDINSQSSNYLGIQDALDGNSKLPWGTTFIKPYVWANYQRDYDASIGGSSPAGIAYSHGRTQIDEIRIEQLGAVHYGTGYYENEDSLLSTKGSHLQDNWYRQVHSYDIKTKQQMAGGNGYYTIVRDTVHPAGLKMFGTRIAESSANGSYESANNDLLSTFSPDSINALAGWWRADAIGSDNVEWKKFTPDATNASNGIFGTNTNRMTAGGSLFEDKDADYLSRINSRDTGGAADSIQVEYSGLSAPPVGGSRSLKITDGHIESSPEILLGPTSALGGYRYHRDYDDHSFGIVLDPGKTWLVSCYAMTSNLTSDTTGENSFSFNFHSSNTSGYSGSNRSSGNVEPFTAVNTWERKSNTINMTSAAHKNTTRTFLKFIFADRTSFSQATGNTYYLIDGIMVEEYDSAIHGATAPFTPSPYVRPGMNGANVVSWYDQSVNEHHVYANTHGGKFYTPQFIANAVNGMPAVRFSANTVKNSGNVYAYSSIGGTVNAVALEHGNATNNKPPTTALQADTMLASNAIAKPVSNSWTIMAVAKTNLFYNSDQYGDTTFAGQEPKATIFNSGYNGSPYHIEDNSPTPGGSGGSMDLFLDRTGSGTRGKIQTHTSNGSAVRNVEGPTLTTNPNTFSIFGISEFAGTGSSANVHFHYNGLRSEIAGWSADTANPNFENDGIVWDDQQPYVTSIGGWAPSNNKIWDTGTDGVNQRYPHGEHAWDGDIAEIVVFNEKLSNTQISLVEGYLAHKYGLQDSLVYKEGATANAMLYDWAFTDDPESRAGWRFNGENTPANFPADSGTPLKYLGTDVQDTYMHIDLKDTPIAGSLYTQLKISIGMADASGSTANYKLRWTTNKTGNTEFDLSNAERYVTYDTPVSAANPGTVYIDLSGNSEWLGKTITGLRFDFRTGSLDADHRIANVAIWALNPQHPYKNSPPPAIGANTWYMY